jgi:hypothetical protein
LTKFCTFFFFFFLSPGLSRAIFKFQPAVIHPAFFFSKPRFRRTIASGFSILPRTNYNLWCHQPFPVWVKPLLFHPFCYSRPYIRGCSVKSVTMGVSEKVDTSINTLPATMAVDEKMEKSTDTLPAEKTTGTDSEVDSAERALEVDPRLYVHASSSAFIVYDCHWICTSLLTYLTTCVVRKMDLYLLPFLSVMYFFNAVDRVSLQANPIHLQTFFLVSI